MIEYSKYVNGKWTKWDSAKIEWAINKASILGDRSGDEFFEDLVYTQALYGGIKFRIKSKFLSRLKKANVMFYDEKTKIYR